MKPIDFWYQGLGQYLHPAVKPGEDPATVALSRSHAHRSKPGSLLRLGGGKAMSLVWEGGAILMADIKPCRKTPPEVTLHGGDWRTIPNWKAEIILCPPAPPFLVVEHGREWDTCSNWKINQSQDFISLSGVQTATVDRARVAELFSALDGINPADWRAACRALERRKRNGRNAAALDEQIDAILQKHPTLDAVLDSIPAVGSDDYEMLSLLCGDREKNG